MAEATVGVNIALKKPESATPGDDESGMQTAGASVIGYGRYDESPYVPQQNIGDTDQVEDYITEPVTTNDYPTELKTFFIEAGSTVRFEFPAGASVHASYLNAFNGDEITTVTDATVPCGQTNIPGVAFTLRAGADQSHDFVNSSGITQVLSMFANVIPGRATKVQVSLQPL